MKNILTPLHSIFLKNLDLYSKLTDSFAKIILGIVIPYSTNHMPQYYKNPNQIIIHSCAITPTRHYKNMDRRKIWNYPR